MVDFDSDKRFKRFEDVFKGRFSKYPATEYRYELLLDEEITGLIAYLNDIGVLVNDMTDYMNYFIEHFVEKLEEITTEKLIEWLQDGTLEDLINDEVFGNYIKEIKRLQILVAETRANSVNIVLTRNKPEVANDRTYWFAIQRDNTDYGEEPIDDLRIIAINKISGWDTNTGNIYLTIKGVEVA